MKKHLIFLFLVTSVGCFGQFTKLTVNFSPSFIDKSEVLVEQVNSTYSMTIMNGKINETCQLTESSVADLQQFFSTYFQKKFTEDSLQHVSSLARIEEGRKRIEALKKRDSINGVKPMAPYINWAEIEGLQVDGIGVKVVLEDKQGERSFEFGSAPGTINQKFIEHLFKLINVSFKDSGTIAYIEKLEVYF